MSLEMWSQVKRFVDGESLNADTLNVPIGQLGDRTSYLYERLSTLGDGMSSVILTNVELSSEEGCAPDVGNVVYLDNDTRTFKKAKASMSLYDDFTASESAFTVGILQWSGGSVGNVIAFGRMDLNPGGSGIPVSMMIESGEEFRSGRYYLSSNEAGKLTSDPNGPRIYVCTIIGEVNDSGTLGPTFSGGTAIVTPQFLDIGTSHVHRTAVLTARPQGELSQDGKSVLGYANQSGFHLLFKGTWSGQPWGMAYRFRVVDNGNSGSGYSLQWLEGSESSSDFPSTSPEGRHVDIDDITKYVEVSNGVLAKLVPPSETPDMDHDKCTWDTLMFPRDAAGWVDHEDYSGEGSDSESGTDGPIYDYVIGMDQQVAKYWPPVPPKSAALVVNGVEVDNKALFPKYPTVSFDLDTVHWYEDDTDRKPWPEAYTGRDEAVDPALDKTMVMHWVRGFQGATGPVTSIQPRSGSPLKIYGYGTDSSANTGDLEIDADIDFEVSDGGVPGYLVPKEGRNGKLMAGPVVERIIAGAGVNLITKAGCPSGQGTVIIALDNGSYRSQFQDIALENAEQAKTGMFPYVRLKGYTTSITSPSAFTATMRVPTNLPSGKYELRLQASVFGEAGFTGASKKTACVKLAYNILPDYDSQSGMGYANLKTGLLKPDGERNILIPFGHEDSGEIRYNGFDPILVMTDNPDVENKDDVVQKVLGASIPSNSEFTLQSVTPELRPGYLVGIRISRAVAQGTGVVPYTAPLGFINLSWSLCSSAI